MTITVTRADALWSEVDANRIRQVLDNLLTNAIKYNRVGGTVIVDATGAGQTVTLTVTDSGSRIDEADRARVFEPYDRTTAARSSGLAGTGLGLSISRDIARRHGGDLRLVASSPAGSCFALKIPLGVGVAASVFGRRLRAADTAHPVR